MKPIIDIVNRDIVNLTNCENEPIHIPGSIQPHGFLLAIAPDSDKVEFCSGNVLAYTGVPHTDLIGKSFSSVFGDEGARLSGLSTESKYIPESLSLNGKRFRCTIHSNGQYRIIEFEPETVASTSISNIYAQTEQFLDYMNSTSTLRELCDHVAHGIRELTGYDRVMVYRFDKDYNGEVFAESRRDDIEPFLGLFYPHTDIPAQARQLYMTNLLRLIADVSYEPVPIYTLDDGTVKNLDLSQSILRSTSPIHVEYLQNIGVDATLTISLIHRDRLWGLIACHHYSPKNLPADVRLSAQLQGQFITSQIDVRQSNEEYLLARKTNLALEKLTAFNLPPIKETFKVICMSPDLLKICNATGVSIVVGNTVYKNGITTDDADIRALSAWLASYTNESTFFTDKLVNIVPDMKFVLATVSGLLYHSLGNGNSIIWYRPETITEVNWAGDPEKAIVRDSKGLHPRNSFNLWKQTIKSTSKSWLQPELNAAANYAHSLQKQISMMLLSQEEENYRHLSEVLKQTNSELENINWISTHDLQEPLRKIQMIASRLISIEEDALSDVVLDSLQRMNNSANRMQTLLTDILKYTRIKYAAEAFEAVNLNTLVDDIMPEIAETLSDKHAVVNKNELPVIKGVPFLLKQLFTNLILNSVKYAAAERTPHVDITLLPEKDVHPNTAVRNMLCHVIAVSDNGIGFEPQYADSIFNIFTRLHGNSIYKGSGVGLALCKKIMQTHEGTITAEGTPDKGATFYLYFPVEG